MLSSLPQTLSLSYPPSHKHYSYDILPPSNIVPILSSLAQILSLTYAPSHKHYPYVILSPIQALFLSHFGQVTTTMINQLIRKIQDDSVGLEASDATQQVTTHFKNTLNYLKVNHNISLDNDNDNM